MKNRGLPALLSQEVAQRRTDITRLAMVLLGRERALEFLGSPNESLGARPVDLVIASENGRALVEAELGRMVHRPGQPACETLK